MPLKQKKKKNMIQVPVALAFYQWLTLMLKWIVYILLQGFSLASAIGHSPKIVPDVREFAVQFGHFVRDDFRKRMLYGNAQ